MEDQFSSHSAKLIDVKCRCHYSYTGLTLQRWDTVLLGSIASVQMGNSLPCNIFSDNDLKYVPSKRTLASLSALLTVWLSYNIMLQIQFVMIVFRGNGYIVWNCSSRCNSAVTWQVFLMTCIACCMVVITDQWTSAFFLNDPFVFLFFWNVQWLSLWTVVFVLFFYVIWAESAY